MPRASPYTSRLEPGDLQDAALTARRHHGVCAAHHARERLRTSVIGDDQILGPQVQRLTVERLKGLLGGGASDPKVPALQLVAIEDVLRLPRLRRPRQLRAQRRRWHLAGIRARGEEANRSRSSSSRLHRSRLMQVDVCYAASFEIYREKAELQI